MLDAIRDTLFRAITTSAGDRIAPLRIQKDAARRINVLLGSPLAPKDEIDKRRRADARLRDLRASGAKAAVIREAAPVMVYFEKDRNVRELDRIKDVLKGRGIAFKELDVTGDEAILAFVQREAHCEKDELPIVFVAGTAVGPYRALVEYDVSGKLVAAVFGGPAPAKA